MTSHVLESAIARIQRNGNTVWGAFLACPLVYTLFGWMSTRPDSRAAISVVLPQSILIVASFLALMAGSLMFRRIFMQEKLLQASRTYRPDGEPPGLPPGEKQLYAALSYGFSRMVMAWMLFDVPAICGLLLVLTGHRHATMLPFVALSMAGIVTHRPRLRELVETAGAALPYR